MRQTHGRAKQGDHVPRALQVLINYRPGTWIQIDDRRFYRLALGTFWREDHQDDDQCRSRSSLSIRNIELFSGTKHKVIRPFYT